MSRTEESDAKTFAAHALQGLLANPNNHSKQMDDLAIEAWRYALSMIAKAPEPIAVSYEISRKYNK